MNIRKVAAALTISAAGIMAIQNSEGLRLRAYTPVSGDERTVCTGHTGHDVIEGKLYTKEECAAILAKDLTRFEQSISGCVRVPLTQNEYDAYTSLAFNIGSGAFCRSTLTRKLNAQDYDGACKEILKWDKFQGKPLAGLTKRRQEEYARCVTQ